MPDSFVQLAEPAPERCAALWRAARAVPAVIKTGAALPWVAEYWTATQRTAISPTQPAPVALADLVHFTSGTTGEAKPVTRTWESLDSGLKCKPEYRGARWACAYPVDRFAGIQVVLSCEINQAVPVAAATAIELAALAPECDAVSATSAMWRSALGLARGSDRLRQITLGGDAADARLLDDLHASFPRARITQTYVSSEAGVICSWSDGKIGMPLAAFRRRAFLSPDGEIGVFRDARTSTGNGVLFTGDLGEVRDGRVYFIGRRDAQINVGGHKICAEAVEEIVRSRCAAVLDCRAFPAPDWILGQHVELEIVTADLTTARREIAAVAWPARPWRPLAIRAATSIPRDPQGKIIRCAS